MSGVASNRSLSVFDIEAEKRRKSGKSSGGSSKSKAAASSAKKSSGKSSGGTKKASSSSKGHMSTQKKKTGVQENPLARRNSAVSYAAAGPQKPKNSANRRPSGTAAPARPSGSRTHAQAPRNRAAYEAQNRQRPPVKKRKKRRNRGMSALGVLMLLMILGSVGFGAWRVYEYKELQMMKAVVSNQTFYSGTYIEGIDVYGMTLAEALGYWDVNIEAPKRQVSAVLNDGTTITAEQMGYSSDYMQVLTGAWNAGRTGSLKERYERITQHMQGSREFNVSRAPYRAEVIQDYVNNVAQQVDRAPVDAKLKSFNMNARSFEFDPEQPGYTLDRSRLAEDIANVLSAGGGSVDMQIATIAPEITLANVQSQYGMVSQAVTNAEYSSANRLTNIQVSLGSINGVCLQPGQSFSFNEVVGKRTKERGFKVATAYSGGSVTEEVGGGICQVSTTLFNAVVKADLKVNERHPHSLTVSYVDPGKDAAVDWGNKDLKFTNSSDDAIYICSYLSSDKRVYVEVYGKMLANGMTVTLEGKKTESVDYETQYEINFNMMPGSTKVKQEGKKGTKAVAYKIWWDAAGNEIKREQYCKSAYRATPEIIEYCP